MSLRSLRYRFFLFLASTGNHRDGLSDTRLVSTGMQSSFDNSVHLFAALQDEIVKVRDASTQTESIGVPEEHLSGHAFHTYRYSPQCACCDMHS